MKKRIVFACLLLALLLTASAASAHKCSFGSWRIKRNPTCTSTGLKFRYCVGCDHWEQKEIAKLPHEVAEWTITKEPTCTSTGGKEGFCSTCNSVVKYRIDELEHEYGEMVIIKEPTCTREGQGQYTCLGCGRKKNESLDKLGHDWETVEVLKEATCTAVGKAREVCRRCAQERETRLDKLEHDYGSWTVTQAPEGGKKGMRERVCSMCGDKDSERFFYEGTLYQDMEPNEEVIGLQEMLKDLGYYDGPIRSGTYGKQTGNAVARFQKEHDMDATEIADPETRKRIEDEWEMATGKQVERPVGEQVIIDGQEVEKLDIREMLEAEQVQLIDEADQEKN